MLNRRNLGEVIEYSYYVVFVEELKYKDPDIADYSSENEGDLTVFGRRILLLRIKFGSFFSLYDG